MAATGPALGVDIGGTKMAMGVVTARGEVLARARAALRTHGRVRSPDEALAALARFARASGPVPPRVVGVAVAASLDGDGRIAYAPNLPGWSGYPLGARLESALAVRCHLSLDGHAALAGERWQGAARGTGDAAMIVIGTGVGGALLAGGRLIHGSEGLAGVAGWLSVPSPDGAVPLERRISGPALAERLSEAHGVARSARDLFMFARRGDASAVAILDGAVDALGSALATITTLLNPRLIVLGGGLGPAFARHRGALEAAIQRLAQPQSAKAVRIVAAGLGNGAGWLGAARLAMAAAQDSPDLDTSGRNTGAGGE